MFGQSYGSNVNKYYALILMAVAIVTLIIGYLVYKKVSTPTEGAEMFTGEESDESDKSTKVLIFFRANWCGHCTRFKPVWDEVCEAKKEIPALKGIDVMEVDVDKEESKPMLLKHNVRGFPHVVLAANGSSDVVYSGNRTKDDMLSFLEKNA